MYFGGISFMAEGVVGPPRGVAGPPCLLLSGGWGVVEPGTLQ